MRGPCTIRRRHLQVVGAASAGAAGLEGIPADFIPEADEVPRRQVPQAGRALGARITLETINANDLRPHITPRSSPTCTPTPSRA